MRLLRRVRALSFHFGLSPGFELCLFFISCFYFSCFYFSLLLLLLFLGGSLARLASLGSLSPPLGTCRRVQLDSAVVSRRSALSRSSRFGRAALFYVAWVCADASVIRSSSRGDLALPYPRPSPLHVRGVQERFISQSRVIDLAPRGEATGW